MEMMRTKNLFFSFIIMLTGCGILSGDAEDLIEPAERLYLQIDGNRQGIWVLETDMLSVVDSMITPSVPTGLAVADNGRIWHSIWVEADNRPVLHKIDVESKAVVRKIDTGNLRGLLFNDEKNQLIAYSDSGKISIFDAESYDLLHQDTIKSGYLDMPVVGALVNEMMAFSIELHFKKLTFKIKLVKVKLGILEICWSMEMDDEASKYSKIKSSVRFKEICKSLTCTALLLFFCLACADYIDDLPEDLFEIPEGFMNSEQDYKNLEPARHKVLLSMSKSFEGHAVMQNRVHINTPSHVIRLYDVGSFSSNEGSIAIRITEGVLEEGTYSINGGDGLRNAYHYHPGARWRAESGIVKITSLNQEKVEGVFWFKLRATNSILRSQTHIEGGFNAEIKE